MARRLLALSVVLSVMALVSLPLAATTTSAATDEPGTVTTIASGDPVDGETATTASMESGTTAATEATAPTVTIEPAVTMDTTPPAETSPDWTYRFFIPTLLVLAALVVIVTVIQYFTRVVRNRYRIVR